MQERAKKTFDAQVNGLIHHNVATPRSVPPAGRKGSQFSALRKTFYALL